MENIVEENIVGNRITDWPHAPPHRLLQAGTYMVTSSTYQKVHYFKTGEQLHFLQDSLLKLADKYHWQMQAWAVFSNHYHFIAKSPDDPKNLSAFISQLHACTAQHINIIDKAPNRKVWWQYWDTRITFSSSYFSRLNYVNQNPVRHGLVKSAFDYPWCSASWFKKTSPVAFYKTVSSFKIDQVNIKDDF